MITECNIVSIWVINTAHRSGPRFRMNQENVTVLIANIIGKINKLFDWLTSWAQSSNCISQGVTAALGQKRVFASCKPASSEIRGQRSEIRGKSEV